MLSQLFNLVYFAVCLSGFIWQVSEICLVYFAYDVTSRVSYGVPNLIIPPGMTLCYRYVELLDYPAMNALKRKNWINDSFNATTIRDIQQTLTVSEILSLTPPVNDSIQSCEFRRPGSYQLFRLPTPRECLQKFNVDKFFILEYICYKYAFNLPRDEETIPGNTFVPQGARAEPVFSLQELANSPAAAGQIFRFEVPSVFNLMMNSKFLLHPSGRFPYKEVEYATVMESNRLLGRNKNGDQETNLVLAAGEYSLTYFTLQTTRLPPPFITMCFNYSEIDRQSQTDCHQRCVKNKSEEVFEKIPFSSIETRDINKTSLSYNDIQDGATVKTLYKLYEECDAECKRKDCDEYTYFTRTSYRLREKGLEFHAFIPSEPSIKVTSKEILSKTEFISFILSTFGTWFGISVLALNPFKFAKKKPKDGVEVMVENETISPKGSRSTFTWTKMAVDFKSKNAQNEDEIQQLIITLTGRVTKIERFVQNYRSINHQNRDAKNLFDNRHKIDTSIHAPAW